MSQVFLALAVVLSVVFALRWSDERAIRMAWRRLAMQQPIRPRAFDVSMIRDLPQPARRYFRYSIEPGTPLYTVAEIRMEGQFSLGNKSRPNYVPMRAHQILAPPQGFVWKVRAGGRLPISGSDAAVDETSWSRFWLAGLLPVARAGGDCDHARAAYGRYIAEAVFWAPAALLPGAAVQWQYIDDSSVRVIVSHADMQQAVDVTVDTDGRPGKVVFQRWSNANAAKRYQLQPFGGYLSDYQSFGGFSLPTRIEAGNFFETEDYFPFFKARVTSIRFPRNDAVAFAG